MKKLLAFTLALACMLLAGCTVVEEPEAIEPIVYITEGLYQDGQVITIDGNIWGYDDYDNNTGHVYVLFYDNGTPDDIYDDEIVGLVNR
jgi:outer membrane biogenesis lipoprotein LolB